jgi:hypothetical protein
MKVQGSHDGGGHHLSIAHLALGVFVMIQGFQDIVTQTVTGYDLIVHGGSPGMKSALQENTLGAIFNSSTSWQLHRYRLID